MCGIAGIINFKNSCSDSDKKIVSNMTESLLHRGPDDHGLLLSDKICFGHRRLSIIDLENGHQPMVSSCSKFTLVFNGEIYNYLELRQKLIQQGYNFKTHSDTEVLLALLIQKGEKALNELNGMFAFVFYNSISGEFILGRDHFGIKPLYYTLTPLHELVFASEIKALWNHPNIKSTVNYNALNEYFTFQFCLNSKTLFNNVHKLEPGCYIKGTNESFKVVRYWDTLYTIDKHHTEDYFRDKLLSLIEDSTRLQVRSDVPVGAYLSGGLDSSTVSAFTANHLGKGIEVFTGKFSEASTYDESHYAKILVKSIDATYNEFIPNEHDFINSISNLIYALDEPVAGPGVFPQYFVSKLAAQKVKVVLGGQGGDELFGGYARYLIGYLEQSLKGAIFETQEEGKHVVTLESIIPNLPLLRQYTPLLKHFWSKGLFSDMDARYFHLINRSPDIKNILASDFLDMFDEESVFAEFQTVFNHPDTKSYVNKMTHFDLKTLLPALLQVEDRVSMSVSLESRVPLLDYRVAELVNSIPPPMKFKGGQTKYIFKNAIKNHIPQEIISRKDKMGFPVPLKEWFTQGPVKDFVCDILLGKKSKERGIFKTQELERHLIKEGTFGRQIWGALCLELWFQNFIDR